MKGFYIDVSKKNVAIVGKGFLKNLSRSIGRFPKAVTHSVASKLNDNGLSQLPDRIANMSIKKRKNIKFSF